MPPKNNTDRLHDLAAESARTAARLDERTESQAAVTAELKRALDATRAEVQDLREKYAVARRDIDALHKERDDAARRRWVVIGPAVAAVLSLDTQVVMTFVGR